ncbi:MAG: LysR family transcriptional regulator [Hyphomicrobiales bacterium]|nr:LysR family transcriptional regulator [Hyphomicrobiales bacterium]
MTLEQLRIFVAVAERQHVTRAAVDLGLTQSTVSAAVRALEERHDVRLFDRVGRRVVLTEAGRLFLDEARAVLARVDLAVRRLGATADHVAGPLRIRASRTIAAHWLPERLVAFRARHPQVEFRLTIGNTASVARAVEEGDVEIGLVEGAIEAPSATRLRVGHDRLVLVAAPGHPLAGRRDLAAADLAGLDWVLREAGSGTRSELAAALARRGVALDRLQVALELPSNEAILEAVGFGGGVAALSSLVADPAIASGRLVALASTLAERDFHLLRHAHRTPSRVAEAFHAALRPGDQSAEPIRFQ